VSIAKLRNKVLTGDVTLVAELLMEGVVRLTAAAGLRGFRGSLVGQILLQLI